MLLKTIATGSSGNCHALISNDNEILLLDVGIGVKEIKRGIDYRISDVVGAVVTHGHLDHSRSVKDFEGMGIPVFKPYEKAMKKNQAKRFCNFYVTAIPMLDKKMGKWQHTNSDSKCTQCPCYGYFIKVDGQKILYITDTKECTPVFRKSRVNHIILGVNHQNKYLNREASNYMHTITGHMNLNTGVEMIRANTTNALRNVILCHLSQENIDPIEAQEEVEKVANFPVYVAKKGFEIELSEFPF